MLELNDVHTYYGGAYVLQGISLQVEKGEVVALLGRNGAGKSTTINTVIGFVVPRRGQVILDSRDVTGWPAYQIARQGVGLVPQGRRLFDRLTVEENITIGTRNDGEDGIAWNLEEIYELFPMLKSLRQRRASEVSGGEQQLVAIARALMMKPRLLLMDEPSEGLAPQVVNRITEIIMTLRDHGLALLIVEQNLQLATQVASRGYIIAKGRIVVEGRMTDLMESRDVAQQYLGVYGERELGSRDVTHGEGTRATVEGSRSRSARAKEAQRGDDIG